MLTTLNPKLILNAIPTYALAALALVAIALVVLAGPELAHAGRAFH